MSRVHEDSIREEFTHQSASFGTAAAMTSSQTLDSLIDLVPEDPRARWIDVACGPGVISRAMASRVGSVHGVDLTQAMVAEAERRAGEEGIENVSFQIGDTTALELSDASFDGAITRLSLHHIPVPGRVVAEMARVVRPGGRIVISDLVADDDREAFAWREEIERLRDPSHWACQTPAGMRRMAAAAGLALEHEELVPVEIDFDDWLARGSGGASASDLIDRLLADPPEAAKAFRVETGTEDRRLHQHYWLARWRRPD